MKLILASLLLFGAAGTFRPAAASAPPGPHPFPAPGAIVDAFPAEVHCWHGRGTPETDLHKASHTCVQGPDGKWLDGTVHVGEHAAFLADHPDRLPDGEYTASSVARWRDGGEEHPYVWTFTVRKKVEREGTR